MEKLLRRFYEPLVLLKVLDPTRGAHRPDLVTERGLDEHSKLWRNFLDQLSFVCDSKKGGDTVTAVAAQSTNEIPIYWLASNSKSVNTAQKHLEWIFARLNSLHSASPISKDQLQKEINARCIEFSSRRIKTYVTSLLKAIVRVQRITKESTNDGDEILYKELRHFEILKSDYHQLCAFADEFRKSESIKLLCERHNADSSRGIWSDIRHDIGKLGTWAKATRILIRCAQKFPQRIEKAQVKVVRPDGPANMPNTSHITDLQGVVRRMLPAKEVVLGEELVQVLADTDLVAPVLSRFREEYANIKPRPHAELLILEHFHHNNFDFVSGDKYIGCSKPSCYSCHIYMQYHPGGFTPRPCHGNLWINWAPPIPLPMNIPANNPQGQRIRPQDHHTFKMLQKMLIPIRQDLQEQILSRRPRRKKVPDSSTGISSVIREMNALGPAVELWNEEYSPRQSASSERGDRTDIDSVAGGDSTLESGRDTEDQQDYSNSSVEGHTNTEHKGDGKHQATTYGSYDGISQQVISEDMSKPHSRTERYTQFERLESDDHDHDQEDNDDDDEDDDSDGGVLLFKGRNG